MLSCKEVVSQADCLLDGTLGRRQRVAMVLHLFICTNCRRYVRQLKALLKAIPFIHPKASDSEIRKVMEAIPAANKTNQRAE